MLLYFMRSDIILTIEIFKLRMNSESRGKKLKNKKKYS